jgi:cobalt/nickel transport system ATP-binding protein
VGGWLMTLKAVSVQDLSYRYPDGTEALREVSFVVGPGERVGIIGANGAGKSTLLLHLNGIYLPNGKRGGSVTIQGIPVEKRNLRAIRQKVGLVFQDPDDQLFCPTVFEDVAFGPRNLDLGEQEINSRVTKSLESVGLAGLETRPSFHLSYGQKKRLSIATVLAMDVEILALDEPSSNLDPRGRRELLELLHRLEQTQIVVTHDFDFARQLCSRVLVLAGGRFVAEGSCGEILSDQSLLEHYGLA